MSLKSGTKTPGGFGKEYKTSGRDDNGASYSTRRKIDKEKLSLIRSWKLTLKSTLKVGRGLNIYMDSAMQELIEELQEWADEYKVP